MTINPAVQQSGDIPGETRRTETTHRPEAVPWHACASEFAGTFFMVAWGLSAVVFMMSASSPMHSLMPMYRIRLLLTGILFAAGGTLVVYSPLGQRSGGHINPAVSLTFWMLGKMGGRDMALYSAAQFLGALAGAGTSLNPARSLGPAVVTDDYRNLWVYFLGPLGGATAAALLWKPTVAAGVRSVSCAKLFHTDRYRCHLADCHYAGRHPPADAAFEKEDLP